LTALALNYPEQVDRLRRITAGWHPDDPRWNDLVAVMDFHKRDVLKREAEHLRQHADEIKRFLEPGEWTGIRMAANVLHLDKPARPH
jgi:hypothetical protein